MKELDENDQGEVEVRISGQRGGGKRHPEIGHAANGTKIGITSHYERDTGIYVALNPNHGSNIMSPPEGCRSKNLHKLINCCRTETCSVIHAM